ncbi:MAG: hypothetical protein IJ197_00150 [Bacteroidaceae bacterium]|nr:hypothetical protein [Bacteroidaceae bacterium]
MANIKNLRMWESICTDARIGISKSLFGLRTTATYRPTNSVIDANALEYSPEDGQRIRRILELPREKRAAAIGDFHPRTADYGNYMAEVCASRDRAFLAVRLFQFQSLNYEAVTDVLIFEGEEANALARLFW